MLKDFIRLIVLFLDSPSEPQWGVCWLGYACCIATMQMFPSIFTTAERLASCLKRCVKQQD